jgi:uncharacterized surface anchored protein
VTFANLPAGTYYYVLRTPPTGYNTDATHNPVVITTTTPVTQTQYATPTDTATLTVSKFALGHPEMLLDDATFSLKRGTQTLVAVSDPTVAGLIAFPNVMTMAAPVTYTVQEVAAPTGYILNPSTFDVPLDLAGSLQAVPNTATTEGSAVVTLDDTNYHSEGLASAIYDLYIP